MGQCNRTNLNKAKTQINSSRWATYSYSIVPGGLEVKS